MKMPIPTIHLRTAVRGSVLSLAALTLVGVPAAPAAAQVSDNQCLTGYVCTAGDVGLHQLLVLDVIDGCTDTSDTASLTFRVSVHNNVGGLAYDIGVYLATDGGDVDGGAASCYHTYLSPPLDDTLVFPDDYGDYDNDGIFDIYRPLAGSEPFFDADSNSCGDMDALSEVVFEFGPVTIACTDDDQDGTVDISVGFSNKQNSGACAGVADAIPGTVSKCTSERLNLEGLDVVPVELMSFSVE